MAEAFLRLAAADRAEVLNAAAAVLGRTALVLEKDVWVCWVLRELFGRPDRPRMAFKGGTSLSKVFGVIARFSEDVDVTLDHRALDETLDPLSAELSRTRLRRYGDQLKALVRTHVHERVVPVLRAGLDAEVGPDAARVEVDDTGEQLRVHYASALEPTTSYLGSSVLVEFGGRNITEPNESHELRPYLAEATRELTFPSARVDVLSAARTFWEKATLMHVECGREEFRSNAARLSRHWYDLAQLADHEIGRAAVKNQALLVNVVKYKKAFYNSAVANYDACLAGGLRLVPDEPALDALRRDFRHMLESGMFYGEPPAFEHVLSRLRDLEREINASFARTS